MSAGIVALRPLGVSEILDGSFKALRRNPAATIGLSAIVSLVTGILTGVATYASMHTAMATVGGEIASRDLVLQMTGMLLAALGGWIVDGMLAYVVAEGVLGHKPGIAEAWRVVRPRILQLIGLQLLRGLVMGAPFGFAVILGTLVAGGNNSATVGLVVAAVGCFIWALWIGTRTGLASPALVLERTTVRGAWQRSFTLSRGFFWRMFGIYLLGTLITSVISSVISGVLLVMVGASTAIVMGGADVEQFLGAVLISQSVAAAVTGAITMPIMAGFVCLLYVDARMRREGLDVDLLRQATGSVR